MRTSLADDESWLIVVAVCETTCTRPVLHEAAYTYTRATFSETDNAGFAIPCQTFYNNDYDTIMHNVSIDLR